MPSQRAIGVSMSVTVTGSVSPTPAAGSMIGILCSVLYDYPIS